LGIQLKGLIFSLANLNIEFLLPLGPSVTPDKCCSQTVEVLSLSLLSSHGLETKKVF